MFTGLIEAVGTIRERRTASGGARLRVACDLPGEALQLGDSIAVDGVCLTASELHEDGFSADLSPTTLSGTTLEASCSGDQVNLERALRLSDRLGGHLVSGHIDGLVTLRRRSRERNAVRLEFAAPPAMMRYIVTKGSVALNGVSLTVNEVAGKSFTVAVIPHSLEMTTLKDCQPGRQLNLETDLIGRYVERLLMTDPEAKAEGISRTFLAKNGFL